MRIRSVVERYWRVACVVVGCWTFLGLLFTPQTHLSNLRAPTPLTWGQAFVATMILFYVWGVMVRGRWLPESELRKMLESIAAINRMPVTSALASAGKADFAGTWTLDKNNTEGLPPGMDQVMTVLQNGDKLSLETKLITEQGETVVPDSYTLDGKEIEFTPKAPNGQTGKGVRTARWTDDGNGIEVHEKSTFFGAEGQVDIQMTRRWTLSPDGKTLRIELTVEGPQGKQQVKRTFIRK